MDSHNDVLIQMCVCADIQRPLTVAGGERSWIRPDQSFVEFVGGMHEGLQGILSVQIMSFHLS